MVSPTAVKMALQTVADSAASWAPLLDATMAEHSAQYTVGMMAAYLAGKMVATWVASTDDWMAAGLVVTMLGMLVASTDD